MTGPSVSAPRIHCALTLGSEAPMRKTSRAMVIWINVIVEEETGSGGAMEVV